MYAGKEIISLCSSDEDDAAPKGPSSLGKRKATPVTDAVAKKETMTRVHEVSDDDEMVLMPAANPVLSGGASSSSDAVPMSQDGADEDLEIMGHTGSIALVDFPHSRENCAAVKFVQGHEAECCANCFCELPSPAFILPFSDPPKAASSRNQKAQF